MHEDVFSCGPSAAFDSAPACFPVFTGDVGSFRERLPELAGEAPRRARRTVRRSLPPPNDGGLSRPALPKVELILYTSSESEKSHRALRAVRDVLDRYDASQVRLSTCDLSVQPHDGEADSVLFTPTLVKQGPGPRTAIIGNLQNEDVLCELLDACGVERRR